MDERLEKALAFSNYRATIENRRLAVERRLKSMLVLYYNNGMFNATQETISFVTALLANDYKEAIVIDVNDVPIQINDLEDFNEKLLDTYFKATNEYFSEMEKIKKARNVKKVMDW